MPQRTGKLLQGWERSLTLYVRQLAWLHTAPKPKPIKSKTMQPIQVKTVTRLAQLQADGITPDLPAAGPAHYLVGHLFEAGPVSVGGMGPSPIDWAVIEKWQSATSIRLNAWEKRMLRTLSCTFVGAQQEAADPDCPAPYTAAPTPQRRAAVERKLRAAMSARATRTKPKH